MITKFLPYLLLLGVVAQLAGANWDLYFHANNKFETFFTAPHALIYIGVLTTIIAAAIEVRVDAYISQIIDMSRKGGLSLNKIRMSSNILLARRFWNSERSLTKLLVIGVAVQLFGGAVDAIWHTLFGFDTLLSPTHLVFWSGLLIIAYSTAKKYSTTKLAFMGYGALAIAGAGTLMILQGNLPEPPIPLWRPPLVWLIFMGFGAFLQYLAMRR